MEKQFLQDSPYILHNKQTQKELRDKCGRAFAFALMVDLNCTSALMHTQGTEVNHHV